MKSADNFFDKHRIHPSLGNGSRISPNKAGITEGQIQREEMRLLLHAPITTMASPKSAWA